MGAVTAGVLGHVAVDFAMTRGRRKDNKEKSDLPVTSLSRLVTRYVTLKSGSQH